MRRSDSAAQRGTSISHPTPPPGSRLPRAAESAVPRAAESAVPRAAESAVPRAAVAARDATAAPDMDGARLPGAGPRGTAGRGRDGRAHLALVRPLDEQPARNTGPLGLLATRIAGAGAELDLQLVAALRERGGNRAVACAVRVLGQAGEHGAVWIAAGAAGALGDADRCGAWVRATAVVGAAHLASMGVKRLVRRPRPNLPSGAPLVPTAGRHGFPSSHAASSAAAAVAFGALLPGTATVPVLAAAICVSRLVAGVHYPSDVACGALLGAAAAGLSRGWALGAPAAGGGFRG